MTGLHPDGHFIERVAARHNLKVEDILWADTNVFGTLVGFKNGTSRNFDPPPGPPPRSMNP